MLAIGSIQAAYPARPATVEATRGAAPAHAADRAAPAGAAAAGNDRPAHFSVISTISPGSLAAAYHAIRGHDAPAAAGTSSAGTPAILSGLGIPAALDAYGEVLDAD